MALLYEIYRDTVSVQNQVGKKFSKTNISKVTRWRLRRTNIFCNLTWHIKDISLNGWSLFQCREPSFACTGIYTLSKVKKKEFVGKFYLSIKSIYDNFFVTFFSFEKILRLNFDPRLAGAAGSASGVPFYTEALSGIVNQPINSFQTL